MGKFTQGPWVVDRKYIIKHIEGCVQSLARVSEGTPATQGTAEANALLMSAAPELFDACHKAIEVLRWCRQDTVDTFLKGHCETAELQILQALLKATGGDLA